MNKQEFEKIAGYEVSFDTYTDIIEPMYMSVSLSKQSFVNFIHREAVELRSGQDMIEEMKRAAKCLKETCDIYVYETVDKHFNIISTAFEERFTPVNYAYIFNFNSGKIGDYPESLELVEANTYQTVIKIRLA